VRLGAQGSGARSHCEFGLLGLCREGRDENARDALEALAAKRPKGRGYGFTIIANGVDGVKVNLEQRAA
jgi:hypothetical protein